jgi:isopentenyldiphosphate isomerase
MSQKLEDRASQRMRLTDAKGNETGKILSRKECHSAPGKKHLAFLVFAINEKNEFALHKRSGKKIGDNVLDSPVSHVLAEESVEDAVYRCLKHEYGIEKRLSVENYGGFSYEKDYGDGTCENEYCLTLSVEYDGKLAPNPLEIEGEIIFMPVKDAIARSKARPQEFEVWFNHAVPVFEKSRKAEKFLKKF